MADLSFLQEQEDSQEELDGLSDEYGDGEGDLLDFGSQEECLSPLARLDKYLHSDNIFNRQMVARSLVDTLRAMGGAEVEVLAVVERVSGLAQDAEPSVRVELMEQLPQLVMFCHDSLPQLLPSALNNHLLPALLSHLADPNNQVRKTAQAALLVLLEQEVMTSCDLEKWVCPVLVELSAPDSNDDVKTEAMAMMCKMAPLVGRDVTEKLFLPRFCELCCDCRMFHVRKVCAANFGDMCTVVGGGATEELLLPRFFQLCGDNVWGVRKACAECFMTVSAASSADVRRTKLASLFINLITDPSRWVRQAAFQSLGQFISTFDSASSPCTETSTSEEKSCPAQEEDSTSHNPPLPRDPALPAPGGGEEEEEEEEDKEGGDDVTITDTLHTETPHTHSPGPHTEATHTPEAEERQCTQPSDTHTGAQNTHSETEEDEDNTATVSPPISSLPLSSPSSSSPVSSPPLSSHSSSFPVTLPPLSSPFTSSPPISSSPVSSPPISSSPISPSPLSSPSLSSSSPLSSSACAADMFNSFHYWRTPLPVIDLDQELLSASPSSAFSSFSSSRPASSAAPVSSSSSSLQTPPRPSGALALPRTPIPPLRCPEPAQTSGDHWAASGPPHSPTLGRKQLEELIENLEPHIDDPDVKAQVDVLTAALRATVMGARPEEEEAGSEQRSSHREGQRSLRSPSSMEKAFCLGLESDASDELFHLEEDKRSKQQDVVPQALLDQYLSMTEPSRAQTVDMEIAKHCAYSLPGVARTLGRHNWHCLRDTYETLASDMQWKVRRTLAFSIHELALILGEELTAEDLLPVFNSFLKDLDEVRVGVLKHLYDFLKLLGVDVRRRYLYQLQEFLVTDNSRNWRFRSELSEQLVLLLQLYSGQEVFDFLRPLAFSLCSDRVSSVRWTSYKLVSEMMRKLSACHALLADFLSQLVNKFCHASKWSHRQTFTTVCQMAVEEECVSLDQFSEFLLLPLLRLAGDPVPNVRVLLARTLQHTLLEREYFVSGGCVHQGAVQTTLSSLQSDSDRDVQYYATHAYTPSPPCDDNTSIASSTY